MTAAKDSSDEASDKEFERFHRAIGAQSDPIAVILRAHLFTETLLERFITARLPRGDKLIEHGNLSYHQKLCAVEALQVLKDSAISSLRNLNKVRNQCAHELSKQISGADIARIGNPLGPEYRRIKRDSNFDDVKLLRLLIYYLCGYINGALSTVEHPKEETRSEGKDVQPTPEKPPAADQGR